MDCVPLFASVATGFETVARNEVQGKLKTVCRAERGHVRFEVAEAGILEVLKLRSIDNVYAVLFHTKDNALLLNSEQDTLAFITSQTPSVNWAKAVEWWQLARGRKIFGEAEIKQHMDAFVTNGETRQPTEESPTFRVTCNRAGDKHIHAFSSMAVARDMGAQLNNIFGWKANMKNFDIEIKVNIWENEMLVMIALNDVSLFKRNVVDFGPTTLRSTLCYSMVSLARPKPGDVLLDPMCGGGSIAIEGVLAFPGVHFLAGDNHPKAIERCHSNRNHNMNYLTSSSVEFVSFDSANLSLRDNCVDAIVTDMPFGKKIGSIGDNRIMYPQLLSEWQRVVVPGGRAVILTKDKRTIENVLKQGSTSWHLETTYMVNVGGLTAMCGILVNHK